jgi:glucokinase
VRACCAPAFLLKPAPALRPGGASQLCCRCARGLAESLAFMGTVNVRVVLTDVTGNVLEFVRRPSRAYDGPDVALGQLIELINGLLRKSRVNEGELRGIGAGISGVLDRDAGITVFWPRLPHWLNVPVRQILQEHYPTLVAVEDTPRTMAFAEHRLGAASTAKQFIFVTLGAVTGAALFINGKLFAGACRFAGDFGHISIVEYGTLCSCGNRGCLETLISDSVLIRRGQEALSLGLSNSLTRLSGGDAKVISVEMIAEAARSGDRFALRLLSEAGGHLGMGIVTLINLLNPELIVIGGALATAAGDLLLPEVERIVRDRGLPQAVEQVRFHCSTISDIDWARGAALLVAEHALQEMFLESVKSRKAAGRTRNPPQTAAS